MNIAAVLLAVEYTLICNVMLIRHTHGKVNLPEDYMTKQCNKALPKRRTGRLETSGAITYENLMNCYTTVTVTSGKSTMLHFKRFDVEEKVDGKCVDYMNVHSGGKGGPLLNVHRLCGPIHTRFNYSAVGNQATMHFVSDNTAVHRGVDVIYVAFNYPPCDGDQFLCASGICIHSSLRCDDQDQCGDASDESNCLDDAAVLEDDPLNIGLIVGCLVAGIIVLLLIGYGAYRLYQWYKWHRFIRLWGTGSRTDMYQYPVTDKYKIYEIGQRGRREPNVNPHVIGGPGVIEVNEHGRYLDEA